MHNILSQHKQDSYKEKGGSYVTAHWTSAQTYQERSRGCGCFQIRMRHGRLRLSTTDTAVPTPLVNTQKGRRQSPERRMLRADFQGLVIPYHLNVFRISRWKWVLMRTWLLYIYRNSQVTKHTKIRTYFTPESGPKSLWPIPWANVQTLKNVYVFVCWCGSAC